MGNRKITICACASRSFIDNEKVALLATGLRKNGHDVHIIADLCKLVQEQSPELKEIAKGDVLACYPRAVRSHFDWLEMEPGNLYDIRNEDAAQVFSEFGLSERGDLKADEDLVNIIQAFPIEKGSDAWFPVLDKSECTDCGKCHDFCLFGVFAIEDGEVKVVQPQNCKNNCPACARVCPSGSIIFPKYGKSPINGGTDEEETFEPEMQEAMFRERLKYRLQKQRERRGGVSLLKGEEK